MNNWIRAFGRALDGVLTFLVDQVVLPINARSADAWEQLDDWLFAHGLTLSQLIGYFLTVAFGLMALGVGVDLAGIAVGQWIDQTAARAVIAIGTLICFLGFLPLLVLLNTAKGLFDLVVRGGEVATQMLDSKGVNLPGRIRRQLEQLRKHSSLTGKIQSFYAAFAALTVSFLCWPNFHGLYGIFVAVAAVSGIIALRNLNRVRGHGIVKLTLAGCYGFAGGGIVFLVFYAIVRPLLLWGWNDAVSNQNALRFSLIAGAIAALVTFLYQAFFLRLGGEEDEIRNGGGPINPYKLKVAEVDPTTGKPKVFAMAEERKFDWGSQKLWLSVAAVVAVGVWLGMGRPNPFEDAGIGTYVMIAFLAVGSIIIASRD